MKKAWIVINHFLKSNKFNELYSFFEGSAKKHNIDAKFYTNAEILGKNFTQKPDFVLFWDKDIRLAKLIELNGIPVFNSSSAIEASDDKYLTYLKIKEAGLPTPETIIAPMTFHNIGYTDLKFIEEAGKKLGFPMVIKEVFGSFGQQVWLANNLNEAESIVKCTNCRPVIFQKFIASSAGMDIRINIVGNKAIASMKRISTTGDFRANLTNGGRMEKFVPDKITEKLAVDAISSLGLDFGGVDLLFGEKGNFYICEVNSNAHFKNIMELTGVNMADKIFEYIGEKI